MLSNPVSKFIVYAINIQFRSVSFMLSNPVSQITVYPIDISNQHQVSELIVYRAWFRWSPIGRLPRNVESTILNPSYAEQHISLSLSLYIYIYIYAYHVATALTAARRARDADASRGAEEAAQVFHMDV